MDLPPLLPPDGQPFDLALDATWVLPIRPSGALLAEHSVLLRADRIAAVVPTAQTLALPIHRRVDLTGRLLMPGLVNLHTHAAMTLMRGLADDLPLMRWLQDHIWPAEAAHVSDAFVHDGTLLACAEMLRGGVTTFNDMYFFPEATARAAIAAGMRAAIGMIAIDFPTAYASDPQDYLDKGLATRDALRGEDRLSFCFAPHAPYTVSDETFAKIRVLADQLQTPVHVHLHETAQEVTDSQRLHGIRPIARLDRLGLLGPGTIAVHAVHLDDADIATLAHRGAHVAHCPASNLKLASGFAPVARLLSAGIGVGLGSDGAASNNRLDLFAEARLASVLAKAVAGAADALPARCVIEMATLAGARALGLDARIGSIEAGKQADLIAIDLQAPELQPCYDPVSHLAYATGREHVTDVWVAGTQRVRDGRLTGLDPDALGMTARAWQARIAPRI